VSRRGLCGRPTNRRTVRAILGATEMAENETLDLWNKQSRRWWQLLKKIESGEPAEEIADEAERCLSRTLKSLVELLPLGKMLEAATRGDKRALWAIVRERRWGRDYAELIAQQASIDSDPVRLLEGVLRGTADRFLDQIGVEVVGYNHSPNMGGFRFLREKVLTLMQPGIARLARQIAEHPGKKPRLPARSTAQRARDQRDLLSLSLAVRSGTDG